MARYVDGFVLAVPKKKLATYKRMAKEASKVWRGHGALEYYECAGEDLQPMGMPLNFGSSVSAKKSETVIFAWIVYSSRAHRDRVNAKVMRDPRITGMMKKFGKVFDMNRMLYGGFDVIVKA